jgi:hypothetical protein
MAFSTHWSKHECVYDFVGKVRTKVKRLGHMWDDNIKIDHARNGWVDVAQDRNQWSLVNTLMNLLVP